jgi:serine/threonine protein kinase
MDQLTSTLSGQTYRVGPALPSLGEGFHRGYIGAHEVLLRLAVAGTPAVAALRAEAQLMSRIKHPQVAAPQDLGETERYTFLVLDTPPERPLAELIHQTELAVSAGLDVALQIAEIMHGLHSAGIAWGRLRPQACTIDRAGRLKLIDVRGVGDSVLTGALTMAEATYLAPELGAGQLPTVSSDLYACGVLAHELLAGRAPFAGANPTELAVKHMSEAPPDLAAIRPDLPGDLVALISRCLRKLPEERPASMAEFIDELRAIQQRLLAEEQSRMIACPRCHAHVPPSKRCPMCNAPLVVEQPVLTRRRIRRSIPLISIALTSFSILCALFAIFDQSNTRRAAGPAPTLVAATATPLPTLAPSPLPTATVIPVAEGTISVQPADVADPNIDLIRVRTYREAQQVVSEIEVVGQIYTEPNEAIYQVLIDTDPAGGDQSTPWGALSADYTILYRSGDEEGMVLAWDGATWQGVGAVAVEMNGGRLALRAPAEWLGESETLRYGVLATNPSDNLTDYAPARGDSVAVAGAPRK